jgi:hypothetical protein
MRTTVEINDAQASRAVQALERALNQHPHLVELEGLRHVLMSALLHGADGDLLGALEPVGLLSRRATS